MVDSHVKLNNPLMGTETYYCFITVKGTHKEYVKLNNPLMGTETNVRTFKIKFYIISS